MTVDTDALESGRKSPNISSLAEHRIRDGTEGTMHGETYPKFWRRRGGIAHGEAVVVTGILDLNMARTICDNCVLFKPLYCGRVRCVRLVKINKCTA